MKADNKITEGEDYYFHCGLMVFTEKYLLKRGYCCGNGCLHCPYNYMNVSEPKRSLLLKKKAKNNPGKINFDNIEFMKKTKPFKTTVETPRSTTKQYSFFEDVYSVVRQIPNGRVTSFGAIAKYLGTKLSARMVGWAMNSAHDVSPKVPAHRVVNRNGMLTGKAHFATPTLMEELLLKEKVKVENDTVVDFEKLFWDPFTELGL